MTASITPEIEKLYNKYKSAMVRYNKSVVFDSYGNVQSSNSAYLGASTRAFNKFSKHLSSIGIDAAERLAIIKKLR